MMNYTTLKRGSRGNLVEDLQLALVKLGYSVGSVGADGDYGKNTETAVRKFQTDHGLTVDGIAGNQTQSAIYGKLYEIIGRLFKQAYEDVCNLPSVRSLMELV